MPVPCSPELRGIGVPAQDVGPPVIVWFVRGYGAELPDALSPGGAPVPELRKEDSTDPATDDPLVALGNGNGGELEPVSTLVGAVTPPVVGETQVLELDKGNGGELDVPEGSCPLRSVPPLGPAAALELLKGNGGKLVLDSGEETVPVPSPTLSVGPAVGPAAAEELLVGKWGG